MIMPAYGRSEMETEKSAGQQEDICVMRRLGALKAQLAPLLPPLSCAADAAATMAAAASTNGDAAPDETRAAKQLRKQQRRSPSGKTAAPIGGIPVLASSWDDLLDGVETPADWDTRRAEIQAKFLALMRHEHAPPRPTALRIEVHDDAMVDGLYRRLLISYDVDTRYGERCHAFLGIPLQPQQQQEMPAMVALHGTYEEGLWQACGLTEGAKGEPRGEGNKAYLDHMCRRGYVVIAPEHFCSCFREPTEGPYETAEFYRRYPEWTAVGKFTQEHSIAADVLLSSYWEGAVQIDRARLGVMGHSLGGHGSFFLAAFDERFKCCVCNCGASFFRHNAQPLNWARDYWYSYFGPHLRETILRSQKPAIDFHEIMALIAPRAFLDLSGLNDGHPGTQRQRLLLLAKLMEVYELTGSPANMAFYVHGQGHSVNHESRELMYGWLDVHLKPAEDTFMPLVSTTTPPPPHLRPARTTHFGRRVNATA